jgi:transcriptional regulator with XRE-family HTH domain
MGVPVSKLGDCLREARRTKGYTVRELAEKLAKTAGYVSRIETGREVPSAELTCKLADVLSVAAEHLIGLAKADVMERTEGELKRRYDKALNVYRRSQG